MTAGFSPTLPAAAVPPSAPSPLLPARLAVGVKVGSQIARRAVPAGTDAVTLVRVLTSVVLAHVPGDARVEDVIWALTEPVQELL